jgi:ABC-type multidrug transport system permease subunit
MNSAFLNLITMQVKEFFREPETLFWAVLFPVALAGVLGVAFTQQDQMKRRVGVWESEPPAAARMLAAWTRPAPASPGPGARSPQFEFQAYPQRADAIRAIQRGEINLFLEPTAGSAEPCYHFDVKNPEGQLTYLLLEQERLRRAGALKAECVQPLVATGTRYIDFLIPGLVALGILNSSIWGIGWALIERRMKKLLRRMVATPMKRYQFFLSFFITRLGLSIFEFLVLYTFAALAFGVRIQGSLPAFILVFLCGNLAFGGVAVLMASKTDNSQVGNGLLNAITIPMMIMSGIFFSYEHFPVWMVPVVKVLPLTVLADAFRKVFIEGAGLLSVLAPCAILLSVGLGCFWIGQKIFKWY